MPFPSQSTFVSAAPRSAWFYVDVIDTPAKPGAARRYLVETEGLQAVASIQQSLGNALERLRQEPGGGSRIRGPHGDAMRRRIAVNGRWDDATAHALYALQHYDETSRDGAALVQPAIVARRMSPVLFAMALHNWVQDEDAIRGVIAETTGSPNAQLRIALPNDAQLPAWDRPLPPPLSGPAAPRVTPLTPAMEESRKQETAPAGAVSRVSLRQLIGARFRDG